MDDFLRKAVASTSVLLLPFLIHAFVAFDLFAILNPWRFAVVVSYAAHSVGFGLILAYIDRIWPMPFRYVYAVSVPASLIMVLVMWFDVVGRILYFILGAILLLYFGMVWSARYKSLNL
jgi:hypothetical protein